MPLKLANITAPSSTASINNWADQKEKDIADHTSQIQALVKRVSELEKK